MSDTPKQEELLAEEQPKVKNDPPIKPKSSKSVAVYLVILFAAAFLLLLMAYFMQQRSNNEVIGNLQNSVSQFQTVDELREENQQLREEIEALEEQVGDLETSLTETKAAEEAAQQEAQDTAGELSVTRYARDSWAGIYTIERLYQTGDYALCAEEIDSFLSSVALSVPDEAAARFQEIVQSMQDMGWLVTDEHGNLRVAEPEK